MTSAILSLLLAAQDGGVHFAVSASPDTVYVGQQVSYDASVRISADAPPRFLEIPGYTPPDVKGVMTYAFPFDTLTSIREVTSGGVRYTQYTDRRAVFPLTAGVYIIPPSLLTYTLVDEADPYASRPTVRRSERQVVVVLPLPAAGRPPEFSGAVGAFTLTARADSVGLRTGRGFVVRVAVTGTGNIALVPRPALTIPWATVAALSDSAGLDLTGTLVRGFKEFRWLVTPRVGGRLMIPPVRLGYFDPAAKAYRAAATAAVPLTIAGGAAVLDGAAALGGDSAGALPMPTYAVVLVFVAVTLIVGLVVGTRRRARGSAGKADRPFNISRQ